MMLSKKSIHETSLEETNMRKNSLYTCCIKRFLDILLSLIALALFWWLFLIIALLVKINLGSPVLFKQTRPGKDEKLFDMYKFRTMTNERDEHGELLSDEKRLTKFGRFLRKTSMDELPELFNILKGEMSIVGTRPLLVSYLPYYTKEERIRHQIRPGLTGWAQVNGRNATSWDIRLQQDIYYVENISFFLDVKIVFMTVIKVIKGSDIQMGKSIAAGRLDEARRDWIKHDTK